MKKLIIMVLLVIVSAGFVYGQNQENPFRVGLWVNIGNETYRTRVVNEITSGLLNSQEWGFEVILGDWDTDIHLIISAMPTMNEDQYAWSFTYTPIFNPVYTNGNVATSSPDISGMNWVSRQIVSYVEEQLFIMMDDMTEGN